MQMPSKPSYKNLQYAYLRTFTSPEGALVLKDLEDTYLSGTAMGEDPYHTARNIGMQDVVNQIKAIIEEALNEEDHNAG